MLYDKNVQDLTAKEIANLQGCVSHLFVEYSEEKLRSIFWELYRAWVIATAGDASAEDVKDMLYFLEEMSLYIHPLHQYCQYLDEVVIKRPKPEDFEASV